MTVSRVYDTPPEDLWDACTNPGRISRWFLPVSGDLREGGRYALEGNASGTIERCDPPRGFDATWEYGGEVSWIEVRLATEAGGRARFSLEHVAHVSDELWAQYGPGAVGVGWDQGLLGLTLHLAGGGLQDQEEAEAWQLSRGGPRVRPPIQRALGRGEHRRGHRRRRGAGRGGAHHRLLHGRARLLTGPRYGPRASAMSRKRGTPRPLARS